MPRNPGRPANTAWTLEKAFDLQRGAVVAFVGGGGKTAAMFRLGASMSGTGGGGWRVVSTTTTHLGREESALASVHLQVPLLTGPKLVAAQSTHRLVLVTGPPVEGGLRWGGVPPEWVAQAGALPGVDLVLVEADGARNRPLKAPATHEPVVPEATTLLVPVVGVEAVGQRVKRAAHRPELVCSLTGLGMDDRLTPEAVAKVLVHPNGGLKGRPAAARVRILVNKVETKVGLTVAREVAQSALKGGAVEAVIIGAMHARQPVREVRRRVAAVVLAAGRSTRLGGDVPKQLLPWQGTTLIRHVVERLGGSSDLAGSTLVVTGHWAEGVKRALAGSGALAVYNADYAAGEMLSSLQTGVRTLGRSVSGCLVVLGDQPWLEPEIVEALLDAYAAGPAGIIAPSFGGRQGHPVLIDRRHWPELLAMESGLAPRQLLQRHRDDMRLVPVTTDSVVRDIDTLDDYQPSAPANRH